MEARALNHERLLAQAHGDEALQHAIAAADLYMQAARKASTPAERSRLNRKCSDVVVLAERLKANAKAAAAGSRPLVPESTRPLTTAEKTIILRTSRLHGNIFPPWESAPDPSVFSRPAPNQDGSGSLFTDPAPFSLSAEQQTIFAGWQRPSEMLSAGEAGDDPESTAVEATEVDLAQDLATDCSVVASLCAAVRHLGPSKSSLLPSLMYPFDHEAMTPAVSKNGKYIFRMYFNGSWRQVMIDDRLPASSTDRTLFVVDRRHPRLLWPALIEKAYLKIRGGYDFPGSNSGTDLHAITGWIPEQIFLQSEDIELDETWDRIKKAFDQGSAIVTLGTGNISPEEEEALGLVKEHDYAVLDLKADGHNRLFLIKNPWCDSLVWTGVGSSANLSVNTAGSPYENMTNMFWMTFEDVLQHFDSLYVNWNPALFTHRQDHHFSWSPPDDIEELVFTHNPQYSILSPSDSPIWILLSRHWQDDELDILRQRRKPAASLSAVSSQLGFTSLSLFATTPPGTRVPLHEGHRCLHQLPYVDSPNTLLRFTPTPSFPTTLVVSQSELPLPKYTFTLSFLSHNPLTVAPAPPPLPHSTTLHSAWTRRTAGGSTSHPSYLLNPQFALTLPSPTPLLLVLSTSSPDLPVHVAVLFSRGGQRVAALTRRDLLGASAEYSRGRAFAAVSRADAGTYTVVASTFEPGHTARFALRVSAACEPALAPVLADAAGRLRTAAPGGGAVRFAAGEERVRARLDVGRLARVSLAVRSEGPGPAVRAALEVGTGPHRGVVAVTGEGEFADAARGLRTEEVDVDPEAVRARGGLWAVVEQLGSLRTREGVRVEVLSDGVVGWGEWEVAEES
ncbi:hypothetical protein B0T18DRAFT_452423 [Schizothecium vesticola]|uniref:Calpain catalytic domain-containing protein n=1 Tax=Schizothecium vesticola TaxID=314040 RepID=A0AA40F9A7_9PEZI|nr:hypothetical protein B0T18DRAFT_452423 [Schizothecium vesticola]